MKPVVLDLSHHNTGTLKDGSIDFAAVAASGIWGIIHKATQGTQYADPMYAARRKQAQAAGLLFGAYHFMDGSDPIAQANWFMQTAKPDSSMCMALDFEYYRLSQPSIESAVRFLHELEYRLGRMGVIYSGNRLKEQVGRLPVAVRDYLTSHRLWLAQYGPKAVPPKGWSTVWLWQYSDGVINKGTTKITGIHGEVDLNSSTALSKEKLAKTWA